MRARSTFISGNVPSLTCRTLPPSRRLRYHVFFVAPAINLNPRTARLLLSEYQVAFLTLIEARFWLLKAIFGITGPFVLQHILQQIGPACYDKIR